MFDFGLGSSELLLVAIVALIVIGPKDLPRLLRTMGQYMRKIQGMAREFQNHLNEAAKEAGVDDVKKDIKGMTNFTVTADLDKQGAEIKKAIESSASRESPANGARTDGAKTVGSTTNGADKAKEPAKIEAAKQPAGSSKPVPAAKSEAAKSEAAKSPKAAPKARAAARPKAASKPKHEAGPKPEAKAKSGPAPKADRPRETAKS